MRSLLLLPVLTAWIFSVSFAQADDAGKTMFQARCGACHSLTPKSGPAAPSLKGVYGRKIASVSDFNYSSGLKAKGGVWTDTSLDAMLSGPQAFAPGTRMPITVPSPADRAALIGYLKTVK